MPSVETAAVHDEQDQAGAGVLLVALDTKRVLLGCRGQICSNPETWAPFGGMVDPGETPLQAAVRELSEEAGIELRTFEDTLPQGFIKHPLYVNENAETSFKFYTYLCALPFEPEVIINKESSGYCWFQLDALPMDTLHPGFAELIQNRLDHIKAALQIA